MDPRHVHRRSISVGRTPFSRKQHTFPFSFLPHHGFSLFYLLSFFIMDLFAFPFSFGFLKREDGKKSGGRYARKEKIETPTERERVSQCLNEGGT